MLTLDAQGLVTSSLAGTSGGLGGWACVKGRAMARLTSGRPVAITTSLSPCDSGFRPGLRLSPPWLAITPTRERALMETRANSGFQLARVSFSNVSSWIQALPSTGKRAGAVATKALLPWIHQSGCTAL